MEQKTFEIVVDDESSDWAIINSRHVMGDEDVKALNCTVGVQCVVAGRYGGMVYKGRLFSWPEVRANIMIVAADRRLTVNSRE